MNISHKNLQRIARNNKINIDQNTKKTSIKLFNFISFLKLIEEELEKNYHPNDKMKCPIHFCHGQEAVPAALNLVLKKKDYLFCHHRSHGYYLSKKCPPDKLFAELHGKSTGANYGFAGSQDISFSKNNFYSGAILAGSVAISIGAALSFKLNNKRNISVTAFGEAATDQGIFWESLNYSALHNLPNLFVCENNNFSVFTPQKDRQAGKSIASKAKSFGVNSIQVYGNNPIDVYNKIKKAIDYVKNKQSPFLIEVFTFRTVSHVGPLSDDPSGLKYSKEYKFWTKFSPYENLKKALIKKNFLNEKKIKKNEEKYKKKILNLFRYADTSRPLKINIFDNNNLNKKLSKIQKKLFKKNKNKIFHNQKINQVKGY